MDNMGYILDIFMGCVTTIVSSSTTTSRLAFFDLLVRPAAQLYLIVFSGEMLDFFSIPQRQQLRHFTSIIVSSVVIFNLSKLQEEVNFLLNISNAKRVSGIR
jgi:hypothetical protein